MTSSTTCDNTNESDLDPNLNDYPHATIVKLSGRPYTTLNELPDNTMVTSCADLDEAKDGMSNSGTFDAAGVNECASGEQVTKTFKWYAEGNVSSERQSNDMDQFNKISQYNQLQILSINVCGLKSKLLCPEFVCLIEQYHIIGIQESKLDDVDNMNIQGYQVFTNNCTAISRHRSGGIAILFKNELSPYITVHKAESKLALWFTISKRIILSDDELHCGIVYIPPYRSKYAPDDLYLELQNENDKYAAKSKKISFLEISTRGLVLL